MDLTFIIITAIIVLFILLCISIFALVVYSGLLRDIKINYSQPPLTQLSFMYKIGNGPYQNSMDIFAEASAIAPNLCSIGVYYDDPNKEQNLRWLAGSVLDKELDESTVNLFAENGFKKWDVIDVKKCVWTTFPFTFTFSIPIAIYRVYPTLISHIKKLKLEAHPMIEVYTKESIHFLAITENQEKFYVPDILKLRDNDTSGSLDVSRTAIYSTNIDYCQKSSTNDLSTTDVSKEAGVTAAACGNIKPRYKVADLLDFDDHSLTEESVNEYFTDTLDAGFDESNERATTLIKNKHQSATALDREDTYIDATILPQKDLNSVAKSLEVETTNSPNSEPTICNEFNSSAVTENSTFVSNVATDTIECVTTNYDEGGSSSSKSSQDRNIIEDYEVIEEISSEDESLTGGGKLKTQ